MRNQDLKTEVSECGTHHCIDGVPLYQRRFDHVLPFHAPGLAPVKVENKAWHIRVDGSDAYVHQFDKTFGFYCGVASVCLDGEWFHINSDGEPLYEAHYAFTGNFQNNLCVVCDQDGNYFHIDLFGNRIYEDNWQYCGDFRESIAVVQNTDGLNTHINRTGGLVHGCWFVDLDVFHKGYARARDDRGWHHIDKHGKQAYDTRYANVEPFYNGCARVETIGGGLLIIDEAGAVIRQLRADRNSHFHDLSADMVGYWKTLTLSAVNQLDIVRYLPATTEEIAAAIKANPSRLDRFLSALVELGIFCVRDYKWALTEKGQYLDKAHPLSLATAAQEYAGDLLQRWFKLTDIIHGDDIAQDIFESVAADKTRSLKHHRMLASYAKYDYPPLVRQIRFKENEVIFDAGGGDGTLAQMLVEHNPRLSVICGDKKGVATKQLNNGVTSLEFDFFKPWPLKADKVILARVIHDWNDEQAIIILRNAKDALNPEGEIFLFEMLLSKNTNEGALCDLHLLVTTGGQERTVEHYESLFNRAGLILDEVILGPSHVSILRVKCVTE